jgi:Thioesterase superfamily
VSGSAVIGGWSSRGGVVVPGRRGVGAQLPGAGDVGLPAIEVSEELLDRRAAVAELGAEGWCTLGHAYEGPPMYGHGGVSAMLIDQLLGHAAAASGHPGVTTELSVRYRRPVPLDVPLRIWGRVIETEGRRVSAAGGITTAAEPDVPLVEAEARFARLRLDQARRLFSRLASPDAANPDMAHD